MEYVTKRYYGKIEVPTASLGEVPNLDSSSLPCLLCRGKGTRDFPCPNCGEVELPSPFERAPQYQQLHDTALELNRRRGVELSSELREKTAQTVAKAISGCFDGSDPFLYRQS